MPEGFTKIGKSSKKMYGENEALLICGFAPDIQSIIKNLLKENNINIKMIFPDDQVNNQPLKKITELPDQYGFEKTSNYKPTIIFSGLSEDKFHKILGAYRNSKLKRPLMASLTPTSENWTLLQLQKELQAEEEEFKKLREQQIKKP